MNKVFLEGYLNGNLEVLTTKDIPLCKFSIAVGNNCGGENFTVCKRKNI